ncbi:MAG TPA: type I-C CRISPR-associated protein Cas8c/Csd1 [Kiritimatiellia bacterium]|nr:type I-C CRISPR-associated protein Cas8c/Csd1 [Kiritimatiellia bacterium]HRZ12383.1 type I-C CRISPR-associated protein Cas8c/Csd1 [Kiritimatiellia bacterium]HSA17859.1 type I-C CRISPR-associated protein Cas8c/Csd1 [Kiritimatiellia bacterium]
MILQALARYYGRLASDSSSGIAPPGYCAQGVTTSLVLGHDGQILQVRDIRITGKGKPRPALLVIPARPTGRTGASIKPGFLGDETGYALGDDGKGKAERAAEKFDSFRKLHRDLLAGVDDPAAEAMLRFLDTWEAEKAAALDRWMEWVGTTVVFEYADEGYLHNRERLKRAWEHMPQTKDSTGGVCLVTGNPSPIARLHPSIKGVRNAQTTGAALVSFNFDAVCSYGKEQSFNAPVSESAAFEYTTALNHLLKQGHQRIQLADATALYWTAQASKAESFMGMVFETSDDTAELARLREWLEAVRSGRFPKDLDPSVPFYMLGLAAPAKARLSVRFWYAGTVGEMGERLKRHFEDLAIKRRFENEPEYPALDRLLPETAVLHEAKNIPETLADAMMRSVLSGGRYPASLLPTLLARAHAEQAAKTKRGKPEANVSYFRAALIKAVLVRNYNMEVSMSLNPDCREPGYLLGRLFAVLERTQEYANPGINATIRDRYYGSASATPAAVFPVLVRLNQHHLSKLSGDKKGLAVTMENLNADIVGGLPERFPPRLNLEQQGMFALGYYHQRLAKKQGTKEEK